MTVKLHYEDLTVTYRDRINGDNTVVDGLNLEVEEGQILGIVGPSGCGKTTLVRALCGFINPDKGNIYVNGKLVFSKEKKINVPPEKRNIGVVFQDYAVWPHLSVYDNIAYPLKKKKVPKNEIPGRVANVLEQVRMSNYAKYMPAQLSGGQQQRVAIARALVSSDDIIVLDEPITNLDAKLREEMIVEIQLIQRRLGATIIYITHDQEAALQLCDKVAIMQPDGKICQIGTDEEIITHPANKFVFQFIGVSNFIEVFKKEDGYYLHLKDADVKYASEKPEGWPEGADKALMGIRPMDIIFDDSSDIRAKIKTAVFLGAQFSYFIELGGQEFRVQRNTLDSLDDREYREDDVIGIRLVNEKYYEYEDLSGKDTYFRYSAGGHRRHSGCHDHPQHLLGC